MDVGVGRDGRSTLVVDQSSLRVETDVIVGELTQFCLVDANDLRLLGVAESEEGDEVEDPAEDGRHDERIRHTGDRVGDLVAQLDVVVVDPPTRDLRQAVQAGNGRLSKEPGEDVTADTTDGVGRKDIYTSGRVRVSASSFIS